MRQINILYFRKALDAIFGKVKNSSRIKNGAFLLKVLSDKQAEALLATNILGFCCVQFERCVSLNSFQGSIITQSPEFMLDDMIQVTLSIKYVKGLQANRKETQKTIHISNNLLDFWNSNLT
jgi:hypothetical protein